MSFVKTSIIKNVCIQTKWKLVAYQKSLLVILIIQWLAIGLFGMASMGQTLQQNFSVQMEIYFIDGAVLLTTFMSIGTSYLLAYEQERSGNFHMPTTRLNTNISSFLCLATISGVVTAMVFATNIFITIIELFFNSSLITNSSGFPDFESVLVAFAFIFFGTAVGYMIGSIMYLPYWLKGIMITASLFLLYVLLGGWIQWLPWLFNQKPMIMAIKWIGMALVLYTVTFTLMTRLEVNRL